MALVFDVSGLSDYEVEILLAGRDYTRHGDLATVSEGFRG